MKAVVSNVVSLISIRLSFVTVFFIITSFSTWKYCAKQSRNPRCAFYFCISNLSHMHKSCELLGGICPLYMWHTHFLHVKDKEATLGMCDKCVSTYKYICLDYVPGSWSHMPGDVSATKSPDKGLLSACCFLSSPGWALHTGSFLFLSESTVLALDGHLHFQIFLINKLWKASLNTLMNSDETPDYIKT